MPRHPVKTARGRPRDPAVEEKVTAAVLELLAERGYQGLTIDQVARRSGISKPTLYARWPAKGELVVAALVRSVPSLIQEDEDIEDPTGRLVAFVSGFLVTFSHWAGGRTVLALHAQASQETDLTEALMRDYWGPRATALSGMLADARAAGVISPSVDDDLVRDLLFGPLIYRWLVTGVPITAESAHRSVTAALTGIGTSKTPSP